jgi:hypothetical protein
MSPKSWESFFQFPTLIPKNYSFPIDTSIDQVAVAKFLFGQKQNII